MSNISIFIISWTGQHTRARAIYNALHAYHDALTIIYSDPDDAPPFDQQIRSIRRPNDLFWADKFQTCLAHTGDRPMLIIHADCACDDWTKVVAQAIAAMGSSMPIGVWSPEIVSGMHFPLEKIHIANLEGVDMSVVTRVDGLVFALSPPVITRMRQASYDGNVYGLGIGWMFCSFCHAHNHLVVIDRTIHIHHSLSRGYDIATAAQQMNMFLRQLRPEEMIHYILISAYRRQGQ